MALKATTSGGKILHNSMWYGLETLVETVVFFGTSIAVARYLGPTKLGYFSYVNFFVAVVTRTSNTGLAGATRKYMAEFLATDRPGTARAVYELAHKYQLLGSIVIALLGFAGIALFGDPAYRWMSFILIASIVPGVMSCVPAQANLAFEDISNNTFSAFAYILVFTSVTLLTLHYHWDLIGIASATLVGRTVEVVLRTIPLHARLSKLPVETLDSTVTARIRRFCFEALGIQLLMSVVWDRSEMFFLRAFSSLEQISFYSVSFTFANNLLLLPRTFGGATGISLMVEAGRNPSRVDSIVKNACRYLLLVAIPVHLGAAAITRSAIGFAYGPRYAPAVPVLIVAAILSVPRAFQELSEVLMRAADRQKQLLFWLAMTAAVNIALDLLLIPRYGAVGAAWGNGISQVFGIFAVWRQASRIYTLHFPLTAAVRMLTAGATMAGMAAYIGRKIPGLPGLVAAVVTAIPAYLVLVKLFRGLEFSDRERLAPIGNRLPGPLSRAYFATLTFITPEKE